MIFGKLYFYHCIVLYQNSNNVYILTVGTFTELEFHVGAITDPSHLHSQIKNKIKALIDYSLSTSK